jgi:hypothetical protein
MSSMVNAQDKRSINMEANLTSPEAGTTIESGESIRVTLELINNGPDDLVVGDSIFLGTNVSQEVVFFVLDQNIDNGSKLVVFDQDLSLQVQGDEDVTTDFCMFIFNDPSTQISMNQLPIDVSYIDEDSTDNISCQEITVTVEDDGDVSILDLSKDVANLNLFPNPATNGIVNFSMDMEKAANVMISVKDITGREVMSQNLGNVQLSNNSPVSLNISQLNAGLYIVELSAGDQKSVGKLTVK